MAVVHQHIMSEMQVPSVWHSYLLPESVKVAPSIPALKQDPPVRSQELVVERTTLLASKPMRHQDIVPSWQELNSTLQSCHQCERRQVSKAPFIGVGSQTAKYLLVSDRVLAPFTIENQSSGVLSRQLLKEWFAAVDINFEQEVFATHVLKCADSTHTPWGAVKEVEQIPGVRACRQFLQQQIRLLKPQKILMLGKFVAQVLLPDEPVLKRLETYSLKLEGLSVIPTAISFPVRHLLENPLEKSKAWQDILFFSQINV